MSMFELWIKGCDTNGTKIYPLEGQGNTALYKCWKEYEYSHSYYNTTPVYLVWINGVNVCATTDYLCAYKIWDYK